MCSAGIDTDRTPAGAEQFSDWSPPVSLGPIINTEFDDSGAFISRDGLRLYFNSNRAGGFGGLDIYVSKRASLCDPWGPPENLGPTVNSTTNDQTAAISPDGRRLYFASDRPGDSAVSTSTSLPGRTSVTTLPGDLRKTSAAQ